MAEDIILIPHHLYPPQLPFADLRAQILIHGLPRVDVWRFANVGDPYWKFYWNKQPGASLTHEGKTYPLEPGSILLLSPFTKFRTDSNAAVDHFHIHFVLESPYAGVRPQVFQLAVNPVRQGLLDRVMSLAGKDALTDPAGSLAAYELIINALAELPAETWKGHLLDARVKKVVDMVGNQENPTDLDNSMLAAAVNMSPTAFIRLFSQQMGISPMKYVVEKRLARAAILLHHSSFSIDQIAEKCGFCDRGHLSKLFKRKYGVGPAGYRAT